MTSKAFGLAQLGNAYSDGALGSRNKIINGAMVIDQRNAGAAVTVNTVGIFMAADRFRLSSVASSGVFTGQRVTDAPSGFNNSLRVTVTTTDTSLAADDAYYCAQQIEGHNVSDLNFGSASAQTITLSFWVKSSLTGTFGGSFSNNAVNRSYPFNYTISAAGTWEYKTVSVAGDTSGTWLKDNSIGLRVYWGLGLGSNFTGTANQWNDAFNVSPSGAVNVMATSGATWQITGVQLEAGDTATPFEHRSFGQELALCLRYFTSSFPFGTAVANGIVGPALEGPAAAFTTSDVYCQEISYSVPMRASPTITFHDMAGTSGVTGKWATFDNGWTAVTATATAGANNKGFTPYLARSGAFVRLSSYLYSGHYSASAEL